MKQFFMFIPSRTDATSFYRASGPFAELCKKMGVTAVINPDLNWESLKWCDGPVFIQRPFTDVHLRVLDMAKANGKKVWVDYDDDLFSVPRSNRAHKIYSKVQNQNNIAHILAKADVVTVSTMALKQKFAEILEAMGKAMGKEEANFNASKIHVVPNAYDEKFCFYRKGPAKPFQNKLITWRGSDTHDKDLMLYTEAMKKAFANHLDWTFNFIGNAFWHTIEELDSIPNIKETNVVEVESIDPAEFWKFLWKTAPALITVPLWDCPFNRAKSNIAWIEGIHAGAPCLAPDWEEWQRPGIINYKDPHDFRVKLDCFMRGEFDGAKLFKEGDEYIKDNLTLRKVNMIREVILRDLWE